MTNSVSHSDGQANSCCSSASAAAESALNDQAPSVSSAQVASSCCTSASPSKPAAEHLTVSSGGCCGTPSPTSEASGCCASDGKRIDIVFWATFVAVVLGYITYALLGSSDAFSANPLMHMAHAIFELFNTMALGLVIGILMVAVLSYIPREFVISILGSQKPANTTSMRSVNWRGLGRATLAGVLLDLCSHGILMVGAKLYERGASTGQVMAFLIASPWNSLSLTIILVALIGFGWTLTFVVLSVVIALITGAIFDLLVGRGALPENPHQTQLPADFAFKQEARALLSSMQWSRASLWRFVMTGVRESKVVIKWLFIGILLAAAIRSFVPQDYFSQFFGPTILGLMMTVFAATVIEVCSEGSTPIAADIFNRANAPGNGFAFLMTGVSTDYTEIMVLKDTTKSWKLALFLPLITLPQIIVLAVLLNLA